MEWASQAAILRPLCLVTLGEPAVFGLAPPCWSPQRILLQAGPVLIQTAGRFSRCPRLSFSAVFSQELTTESVASTP